MDNINFYCINLEKSKNRRNKMKYRFTKSKLQDKLTFIDAIDKNDKIIDYYGEGEKQNYSLGEIACFASHLKAVRTFISESDNKWGIICEDDIMLKNNFSEDLNNLFLNIPEDTTLVSLSYLIPEWKGFEFGGIDKSKEDLYIISVDYVWGAQMYMISREYAKQVISKYDKPFRFIQERYKTSELITRFSKGFISTIPLAIEDSSDSCLRDSNGMIYHINILKNYVYSNYSDGELIHNSPLANYTDIKHLLVNGIFMQIKNNDLKFETIGIYDPYILEDIENNSEFLPNNLNTIFISSDHNSIIKKDIIPNIPVLSKNIDKEFSDIELPKDISKLIELIKLISYFQNYN